MFAIPGGHSPAARGDVPVRMAAVPIQVGLFRSQGCAALLQRGALRRRMGGIPIPKGGLPFLMGAVPTGIGMAAFQRGAAAIETGAVPSPG